MDDDTIPTRPIAGTPPSAGVMTPPPPPPPAPSTAGEDATPATPEGSGLRDRVLGLRAVAAVALASLVLGGLGGAALGTVSDGADVDQRGPAGRGQFPPGGQQGQLPGGGRGGQLQGRLPGGVPGGVPGQLPPRTAPQDDVVPDGATDQGGGTGSNT